MRDRVFYTICFGFVFGVLIRSFVVLDIYITIVSSLIAFSLLLFFSLISRNNWGIIISIFALAFSLGLFRFHVADEPAPQFFEQHVGQKASFTGTIIDEPDTREDN